MQSGLENPRFLAYSSHGRQTVFTDSVERDVTCMTATLFVSFRSGCETSPKQLPPSPAFYYSRSSVLRSACDYDGTMIMMGQCQVQAFRHCAALCVFLVGHCQAQAFRRCGACVVGATNNYLRGKQPLQMPAKMCVLVQCQQGL